MTQHRNILGWLRKYGVFFVALFLFFVATISVSAQLPTGTILGTVKDTTGGTMARIAFLPCQWATTRFEL